MTLKALDLFCGAGGASMGLHRAGLDVTGVDISPQPNYPFKFIQADALTFDFKDYDFIWASPPCQVYTWSTRKDREEKFPDLIETVRYKLQNSNKFWVIENVVGAPLINPIRLCGEMFGLRVIRHRLFESNVKLKEPKHIKHKPPVVGIKADGGQIKRSYYCCVAGHGGNSYSFKLEDWQEAMGIDWMTKEELTQAIPPAYSEHIARDILLCEK